ncbi:unnamed protein product [Phytomonas sp. EM1]|nr:unnamed protein product [Phytomonas sp. EM1]|eukprot:CCW63660.1 unnamed protein product [Phytomonas sp. isolate EM1]
MKIKPIPTSSPPHRFGSEIHCPKRSPPSNTLQKLRASIVLISAKGRSIYSLPLATTSKLIVSGKGKKTSIVRLQGFATKKRDKHAQNKRHDVKKFYPMGDLSTCS